MLIALNELSVLPRRLPDLVKRIEAGEDVVLTHQGHNIARLMPLNERKHISKSSIRESKMALMDRVRKSGARKATPGPDGASSQDFLYDDTGLPA